MKSGEERIKIIIKKKFHIWSQNTIILYSQLNFYIKKKLFINLINTMHGELII